MADEQPRRRRFVGSPFTWRSHSAPSRKKWYRRGPLTPRTAANAPACSMLYDQMVSRRLVGAIAAWHDLHASLLHMSLQRADSTAEREPQPRRRSRRKDEESSCSSDEPKGPASRNTSCRRQHNKKRTSVVRRVPSNRAAADHRLQVCAKGRRSRSPRGSASGGSLAGARHALSPSHSHSRSSSVASAGSSSAAEGRRTLAVRRRVDVTPLNWHRGTSPSPGGAIPPGAMLALSAGPRRSVYGQRRAFSVAKVEDQNHHTGAREMALGGNARLGTRRGSARDCSCCEESEEDSDWERESALGSQGAISDAELDALVAEERRRPKLSLSNPELSPEQLKQLFPELSDHWSHHDHQVIIRSSSGSGLERRTTERHDGLRPGELAAEGQTPNNHNPQMLHTLNRMRKAAARKHSKAQQHPDREQQESTAPFAQPSSSSGGQQQRKKLSTSTTVIYVEPNNNINGGASERCSTGAHCSRMAAETNGGGALGGGRGGNRTGPEAAPREGRLFVKADQHHKQGRDAKTAATRQVSSESRKSSNCSAAPLSLELNANSLSVLHSPATSPGGSSTHSQRSFHFHLPASMSHLRKSGVHLVRNIPTRIRRSSLAMMRAMGAVGGGGGGDSSDSRQRSPPCEDSLVSSQALDECCSLRAESTAAGTTPVSVAVRIIPSAVRKRSATAGTAAKRAMRKRISAAKLTLRKISRLSTHSAGTNTLASSSSAHSSPRTPCSVHGYCGGNSPVWLNGPDGHPLRKCLSRQLLEAEEPCSAAEEQSENRSDKGSKKSGKHGWARIGRAKKASTAGEAKRCPALNAKKPLRPSLSWDPQQQTRSRSASAASTTSRSRIHSDGSAAKARCACSPTGPSDCLQKPPFQRPHFEKKPQKRKTSGGRRRKKSSRTACAAALSHSLGALDAAEEEGFERNALELNCLHCELQADYRTSNLRTEIESAVKQLAMRLSSGSTPVSLRREKAAQSPQQEHNGGAQLQTGEQQMELLRRQMGTPDIVVSSYNSEETPESADEGFWTTSSVNGQGAGAGTEKSVSVQWEDSGCSPPPEQVTAATAEVNSAAQSTARQQQQLPSTPPTATTMDTLKPPGFPFGLPCSSSSSPAGQQVDGLCSPPRSNSVDLSQLRRDIELWSVSSLSSCDPADQDLDGLGGTNGSSAKSVSTPGGDSVRTIRSRSYDPSSSPEHMLRRPSRIEHLSEIFRKALAKSPVVKRAAAMQEQEHKRVSKHRTSRYWLEDQLGPSEHIWLPSSSGSSSATVDTECYLGERDCEKVGEKRRCSGCHIVAHTACFPLLAKMNLSCKTTFRDCMASTYRRQPSKEVWDQLNKHHWVHRWRLEGRCSHCGKSFQQKMFREKEVIAITCSWCKRSYHNKRSCFSLARFDDRCDRGVLRELILPPGWLLRLSNQRRQRNQRSAALFNNNNNVTSGGGGQTTPKANKRRKYRPFVVRPVPDAAAQPMGRLTKLPLNGTSPTPPIQPLLVFVNPKSGGNKGSKTLNTLCWLLNPRQVFDINAMRGPKYGLEVFRKIGNQLRILVCGGDGTVGWVLSTLDQLSWPAYPPIALLPLGTGNDLSRCMGWGGTFSSDEPLVEVLAAIQTETSVTHLDRWRLDVFPLPNSEGSQQQNGPPTAATTTTNAGAASSAAVVSPNSSNSQQQSHPTAAAATTAPPTTGQTPAAESGQTAAAGSEEGVAEQVQWQLALSVMNNYFSIGADAHVALQFHQSRSENPKMLNSRLKNRIAYGGLGTIDLFKRTWKDLSEYITVECDGVDISAKIREFKFHCVLFHNISFYAGGTVPWGGGDGVQESCGEVFSRPSPCDGKIEVLGFTTATLAALQMGGKGERIAQCSKVRIETSKPIPMQVDGEPCLLGPSLIHLSFHNKVPMLRREKFARLAGTAPCNNIVSMGANRRKSSNNSSGANSSGGGMGPQQNANNSNSGCAAAAAMTSVGGCRTDVMRESPAVQPVRKISRTNLSPVETGQNQRPATSSPPNCLFLGVPVIVVGRHDYDTYRDSVDRLKDTGFELGVLSVEAETELFQLRQQIQRMLTEHEILPYEPDREWRFLDYVSNSEEGTFRVSRHQELSRTVADVCSLDEGGAGIMLLDDAFPSMTARSAAIGHDLVFTPAKSAILAEQRELLVRRRISETLRIMLSSDSQETHL